MKLPVKAFHTPQRTETAAELRDATDRLVAVFERIEDARDVTDRLNAEGERILSWRRNATPCALPWRTNESARGCWSWRATACATP